MRMLLPLLLIMVVFLVISALMRTSKNVDKRADRFSIERMTKLRNEYDRK